LDFAEEDLMRSQMIELFGRRIPIKTSDSEDYILSLVDYVQKTVDEIDPSGKLPEMTLAVLALLNLGDELFQEKKRLKELAENIRKKYNFILENIDRTGYIC
jgi:cell division protein ZapA (FtsZ GTPase activity inhibitor)